MATRTLIAAPTDATALTAAPVKGVVLLLGVTAPVPDADGADATGAAAAVVVGYGMSSSALVFRSKGLMFTEDNTVLSDIAKAPSVEGKKHLQMEPKMSLGLRCLKQQRRTLAMHLLLSSLRLRKLEWWRREWEKKLLLSQHRRRLR